jgi:hypothetical protein
MFKDRAVADLAQRTDQEFFRKYHGGSGPFLQTRSTSGVTTR